MHEALPDLLDLAVFRHAVDGGSLRAAARTLDLSPAVASRRLARLEERLGIRLLVRTTRTIHVTPEAQVYYAHCVNILDEVEAAAASVSATNAALRGRLRVTMPTAVMATPFLTRLHGMLDAHPDLEVELHVSDQLPNVLAGGFDLAIVVGQLADSSLLGRRIGGLRPTLAATPSYVRECGKPRRPSDLSKHRCLRFREDRRQSQWVLWDSAGKAHPVAIAGNLVCDSSESLGRALYAGLGIGARPSAEVERAAEQRQLVRILPRYRLAELPVFATYPQRVRQPPAVVAFIDLVSAALED